MCGLLLEAVDQRELPPLSTSGCGVGERMEAVALFLAAAGGGGGVALALSEQCLEFGRCESGKERGIRVIFSY